LGAKIVKFSGKNLEVMKKVCIFALDFQKRASVREAIFTHFSKNIAVIMTALHVCIQKKN
jgi:hypothetical protein